MRSFVRAFALMAALASPGVAVASPIAAIQDDRLSIPGTLPGPRLATIADLGARLVRMDLRWDLVATGRPAKPRDPNDPAYDWHQSDVVVAAARAKGIEVLFTVWGTPGWAADGNVPIGRFPAYARRPARPADFGDFGAAAAARYAPQGVHRWEGWNEPNIPLFLIPQFARKDNRWINVSADTYSQMQSAFYAGVKGIDAKAEIAGAVTAPVGDTCPISCPDDPLSRTNPVEFIRALDRDGLRPPMDVVSHHPYPQSGPRPGSSPTGYVDLYNLSQFTAAIDRSYLRGKRLWLTEIGFATAWTREYSTYFTPTLQAQYLSDAYQRVAANPRVAILSWYFLQDEPNWKSGLLNQAGKRKPAYDAFALPIAPRSTATVKRGGAVVVAGQIRVARGRTRVRLERRAGGRWTAVTSMPTAADGSFQATLRPTASTTYRARWSGRSRVRAADSRTSAPFTIRVG